MLRREEGPCVSLSNPKHVEYEVVRTSLLPGALKTAQFNRAMPVRAAVDDVVVLRCHFSCGDLNRSKTDLKSMPIDYFYSYDVKTK